MLVLGMSPVNTSVNGVLIGVLEGNGINHPPHHGNLLWPPLFAPPTPPSQR
jgi:hypothetical protein